MQNLGVFYSVFAAAALIAGIGMVQGRRVPVATIVAVVVIGVPTLVQLTVDPGLLGQLERDRGAIGHGEVWRLVTSLVVQDGLVPGAIANLAWLLGLGMVAEWLWGWRRWTLIAVASGVLAQLWGLVVQPVGGGNSVMYFGLGASVAVLALRRRPVPAIVALAIGGLLLVLKDIHGGAAVIGAVIALAIQRRERAVVTPPG